MIACNISQSGTSTVGTNDHGSCCIASDRAQYEHLQRRAFRRGNAECDGEQEIGDADRVPWP